MEKEELALRRKAIRLTLKGLRPCEILKQIPRHRTWLYTWQTRFRQSGWFGLQSRSRRPASRPRAYDRDARRLVIGVRRALERRRVGLIGAQSVELELR